ncbi:hypothetical protein DP116_23845 [Brasilonema bromeliae SPC951]|uniref:Transposase n=1 Tax=Brasilonema bromeliae SPC951 TaxID=385972 RepID=A0ABX1PCV5_9CYAN|nr:hypothetical protein [Brasilonema bromeliae SPC951]
MVAERTCTERSRSNRSKIQKYQRNFVGWVEDMRPNNPVNVGFRFAQPNLPLIVRTYAKL